MAEPQTVWFPQTRAAGRRFSQSLVNFCAMMGLIWISLSDIALYLVRGRLRFRQFAEQAAFIGVDALGISLIMTLFAGMVIALQISQEMTRQGAGQLVGGFVAMAILRELAPIMTGFAVIAMVGSAYAAELSTMRIQSQVDAMQMLRVDPERYLVLPRVVAAGFALPLMTTLTAMAGIVGGMAISNWIGGLSYSTFLDSVWQTVQPRDMIGCLTKAGIFGVLIVLFSTSIGLNTKGGAKDVGIATTRAVVWSFMAMSIADYVLSYLFFGGMDS